MFQLCLVALVQECECLHSCVPCLIHISPKASTSAFDKSVNLALGIFDGENVGMYFLKGKTCVVFFKNGVNVTQIK